MKPLLDERTKSIGAPRPGGNERRSQGLKLGLALLVFASAGFVFIWSQGYLGDSSDSVAPPSPEQLRQLDIQKERATQMQRDGIKVGGA
jgi:hypothetical protein